MEGVEASASNLRNRPKRVSLFDIIQKDVSTSCIDLIDLDSPPSNKSCVETVIVDSCTNKVATENELLKQEVDHLMKDLIKLKGKKVKVQLTLSR